MKKAGKGKPSPTSTTSQPEGVQPSVSAVQPKKTSSKQKKAVVKNPPPPPPPPLRRSPRKPTKKVPAEQSESGEDSTSPSPEAKKTGGRAKKSAKKSPSPDRQSDESGDDSPSPEAKKTGGRAKKTAEKSKKSSSADRQSSHSESRSRSPAAKKTGRGAKKTAAKSKKSSSPAESDGSRSPSPPSEPDNEPSDGGEGDDGDELPTIRSKAGKRGRNIKRKADGTRVVATGAERNRCILTAAQEDDMYEWLKDNHDVPDTSNANHLNRTTKLAAQAKLMNRLHGLDLNGAKLGAWLNTRRKNVTTIMNYAKSGTEDYDPETDARVTPVQLRAWNGLSFLRGTINIRARDMNKPIVSVSIISFYYFFSLFSCSSCS